MNVKKPRKLKTSEEQKQKTSLKTLQQKIYLSRVSS